MIETRSKRLRVLFAPETFNLGEASRAVEVARAVAEAGHEVHFMGYSRRFVDYITSDGFSLELLEPELSESEADRLIAVDQGRSVRHPYTVPMVRRRVTSELALIDRWRPHAVVIGTTLTLFISARAASVPLIYIRPFAMSSAHVMTMKRFPLLAGTGAVASVVNRLAAIVVRGAITSLRWKPRSFRIVAAENGVRLPARTVDAIDADLNLLASVRTSTDCSSVAGNEVMVGPIYAKAEGDLPSDVQELAGRTRPVGLGSSANHALALTLLRQLGELDIDIVTTAGRYLTDSDRMSLPANVWIYDFLPAHRLAGLIDSSVIHGGEGTVQTACASGVPFAGIGLQPEQRFNVDACVQNGNALRIPAASIRRKRAAMLVERLLHDADLRDAAREGSPRQATRKSGGSRAARR